MSCANNIPATGGGLLSATGYPRDAGEELCYGLARETPGDEDQARSPIVVRPVLEFDRRVGDMLDNMNDHRPAAFGKRREALDAQQIGAAQTHQHRHGLLEARPAERLVKDQREAVEPVRVVGLGEVKIASGRNRLVEQEGQVDLAVSGDAD